MRAALGYDRQYTNAQMGTEMTSVIHAETESDGLTVMDYVNRGDAMREYLFPGPAFNYRPRIKVVPDTRNNVHRMCTYTASGYGRVWMVLVPMQDQEFTSYYLILNTDTGERRIVWDQMLTNLY